MREESEERGRENPGSAEESGVIEGVFRPRRLRAKRLLREMTAETEIRPQDLVYPLFVRAGRNEKRPIASMPGISQFTVDRLEAHLEPLVSRGLASVILFGIPERKDAEGSGAWDEKGPVPEALRLLKKRFPELVTIADVCLCEYTDHGHCGPVRRTSTGEAWVENDAAVESYATAAAVYAAAGADIVAPSGMMDGMVEGIRFGLDACGFQDVAIMAYSAKYASYFYGPFRDAAESPPGFGDRRTYQMDPRNRREALREVMLDLEEGADIVMVKPALPYLDIIREVREECDLPVAAYNVSGEYSMLKAAIERGWLSREAMKEVLISIKRAGADIIITYAAPEFLDVHGNHTP